MKFSHFTIGLLALVSPVAAAWTKEDREIFRIRDEIAAHETDPAATFYEILGITNSASQDDINKAYRTKTRALHPDKVTQQLRSERTKGKKKGAKGPSQSEIKNAVKLASERQARLSLIANILRGEGRERYDHYLANGFPLWKGTDYYYNRYRPGLGSVLIGVFLVGGGAVHYFILYMGWKRQKEFVQRYVKYARDTAWGGSLNVPAVESEPTSGQDDDEGPPQPMNRRERRMRDKENKREGGRSVKKARKVKSSPASRDASTGPTGQKRRVVAENGKILVVDSLGDVYLEEEDKDGVVHEFLLDPNEIPQPTIKDTAIFRAPLFFYDQTLGRVVPRKAAAAEELDVVVDEDDSDEPQRTPSTDSAGEDFELLDKSVDSLGKAKSTGTQKAGKPSKRKGRKK
ncbi:dnaJ domain-containing protein [Sarocladium implicatum]|nr:dnaJ domain-containing protein [Sarocladium implicatum]